MGLLDDNILWTKAGSAGEITSPENGPGGVIVSTPIFIPVKFDNGVKSEFAGEYISWSNLITAPNKYIVEFWLMPDGFNIVNSRASDGAKHEFYDTNGSTGYIQFQCRGASNAFGPFIFDGANAHDLRVAGINISNGVKAHIMLVLDASSGFDGAKKSAWYLDGVQKASSALPLNYIANQSVIFGAERVTGAFPSKSGLDNLKIYQPAAITPALLAEIIANKDNEGFPVEGGFRMLDGGLKSSMLEGVMVA